jgi:hypothetical protein
VAGRLSTYAAYGLVLVLTVLLAVWGAFLVPLRLGGQAVPVCWAIAVVGNYLLGICGGRLLGRLGAGIPGLLWMAIALTLGSKRGEGDLVVPGSLIGLGFLLAGAVASAVAYGLTSPGAPTGRSDVRGG